MAGLAKSPWPIDAVLPHEKPMILLDEVLDYNHRAMAAAVTIRADHPFIAGSAVPVQVGLELMAQACGAYAGANALDKGEPVRLGFLLGTRGFEADTDWFQVGERLVVHAEMVYRDDELGAFDCRIERDGQVVAKARLNVYQPKSAM